MKTDVNYTAAAFLRKLEEGQGITPVAVEHVTSATLSHSNIDVAESFYAAGNESLQDFVARIESEFAAIPPPAPDPTTERIEVEEQRVIIALGRSRYFNGFLGQRPVFGFDSRLSQELSETEADQVQRILLSLGFETVQRPSLAQKESAF